MAPPAGIHMPRWRITFVHRPTAAVRGGSESGGGGGGLSRVAPVSGRRARMRQPVRTYFICFGRVVLWPAVASGPHVHLLGNWNCSVVIGCFS